MTAKANINELMAAVSSKHHDLIVSVAKSSVDGDPARVVALTAEYLTAIAGMQPLRSRAGVAVDAALTALVRQAADEGLIDDARDNPPVSSDVLRLRQLLRESRSELIAVRRKLSDELTGVRSELRDATDTIASLIRKSAG